MKSILSGMTAAMALAMVIAAPAFAKPVTAEDAAQFKVGEATSAEVIGKLGKPMSLSTTGDGTIIAIYGSMHASPNAMAFVPIVGLFAAQAKAESNSVIFTFGPDGLLKTTASQNISTNCRMVLVSASCGN